MLVPYNVDVPMERYPVANWALIVVTILVSIGLMIGGRPKLKHQLDDVEGFQDYHKLKNAIEERVERGPPVGCLDREHFHWWQLFTYTMTHADPFHLAGNMIFLFCFGNAVNAKLGHGTFLGLYVLLGAVAGGAWLALGQGTYLLGASGAIMGVVGLFLVLYPNNDVRVFYWLGFTLMGTFDVRSWAVALVAMISDLFGTLFSSVSGSAVAYICHLGGEFVGVGIGLGLVALKWVVPSEGEVNLLQMWGLHPPTKRKRRRRSEEPLPISRPEMGEKSAKDEDWNTG
jgi:membrane associated rhomboid family serine protease